MAEAKESETPNDQGSASSRCSTVDELIPFCEPCSSSFFGKVVRRTAKSFPDVTDPLRSANELETIRRCTSLIEAIYTGKIRVE